MPCEYSTAKSQYALPFRSFDTKRAIMASRKIPADVAWKIVMFRYVH